MRIHHVPATIIINDGRISSTMSHAELPGRNITASLHPSSGDSVYINGTCHPVVRATQTIMVAQNSSGYNQNWVYDPLVDMSAWHGNSGYFSYDCQVGVSDYDINQKFWERRELNEWLLQNGNGDVYIQRQQSEQWKLSFTDSADARMFQSWFQGAQRTHRLFVKLDEKNDKVSIVDLETSVNQWCREQLKNKWQVQRNHNALVAWIRDDAEAVMFKLAFSATSAW